MTIKSILFLIFFLSIGSLVYAKPSDRIKQIMNDENLDTNSAIIKYLDEHDDLFAIYDSAKTQDAIESGEIPSYKVNDSKFDSGDE